ncbi:MAG TPA: hypothetical protein VJR02_13245, partial [Pyrinomonadaceae bacterium]|nr:hypothetical protein [Pyrinomonadaceae bacterium]
GDVAFYDRGAKNINAPGSFISIRSSGLFESGCDPSFKFPGALALIRDNNLFADGISVSQTLYSATAERHLRLSFDLKQSELNISERRFAKGQYYWNDMLYA